METKYLDIIKFGLSGGISLSGLYILDFLLGVEVLHNVYNTRYLAFDFILEPLLFTTSVFICAIIGVLLVDTTNKNWQKKWDRVILRTVTCIIIGIMVAVTWLAITFIESTNYGSTWIYSTMIMTWPLLYSLVTMALGHDVLSNIYYAFMLGVIYAAIIMISGKILKFMQAIL